MKIYKRIIKGAVAIGMIFALSMNSYASSISDVEGQKDQAESNRDDAQQKLEELQGLKNDLVAYVSALDTQANAIQTQINDAQAQKAQLETEIAEKEVELETAKTNEANQYESMKQRLVFIYENGDTDYLEAFLSASSMSDIVNKSEYVSQLSDYDTNMLNQLVATREDIANQQQQLQNDHDAVSAIEEDLLAQQDNLQALIDDKNAELATYTDSIAKQQELCDKYDNEVAQYEAAIRELERQAYLAEQAANGGAQTTYTGGQLAWPCPASSRITSYFGGRNTGIPGASTNHKGIDIGVGIGNAAVAAADGQVIEVGYNSARGNYVIVYHSGGLSTLYQHCSSITVTVGTTVTRGQTVALTGNTGIGRGSHLHFEVRTNGTPVDPLPYLGL